MAKRKKTAAGTIKAAAPLRADATGNDGLSLPQRQLLMLLASGQSPSQACLELDINTRAFVRWQKQPAFSAAMDSLFSKDDLVNLKRTLNISAAGTVEVLEEAMTNANRNYKVEVTCPECGKGFDAVIRVEDWKSRLHAVDTLLKIAGILLERKESKVDISIGYRLTFGEQLALLKYERGEQISPQLESRLRELGKLSEVQPALPVGRDFVEAEFSEVPEDKT